MEMRHKSTAGEFSALAALVVMFLAMITPLTPMIVGAIEIAHFDTGLVFQWIRTTGVEETIAAFYRSLGWPG